MNNIALIVAMDNNRTIGLNESLPWNIPEDLTLFKEITTNNIVIMGRKTFSSIGKALPNRINIVLSSDKNFKHKDVFVFSSLKEIDNFINKNYKNKKVFIIGGESIYNIFLDKATELHISLVHQNYFGDTFFPNIDLNSFYMENSHIYKDFTYFKYIKK